MPTFAVVVETPPLYKDLRDLGSPVPGLFFLQFLSAFCLKVTKGHFCHYVLFADNQEGGCIPATTFRNSNLILHIFLPSCTWKAVSGYIYAGLLFIDGRHIAIDVCIFCLIFV